MELFEEALQKWEQALSVGQRGDGGSTPTPGDSLRNPETASEVLSEVGGPHPDPGEAGGQPDLGRPSSPASCQPDTHPLGWSFPLGQVVSPTNNVPSTCLALGNYAINHRDAHTLIPATRSCRAGGK